MNVMVYTAGFLQGKRQGNERPLEEVSLWMDDGDWAQGYLNGYHQVTGRRGTYDAENQRIKIPALYKLGAL